MTASPWFTLDRCFRERLQRGEPPALNAYLLLLCRRHGVTARFSAYRDQWFARLRARTISVPPPIDLVAMAIALDELADVLSGECAGPGHQGRVKGRSHECLKCEADAWRLAREMFPFTLPMHKVSSGALASYRETPAPHATQREADRVMGSLSWAQQRQQQMRWQDAVDRQRRVVESLNRDRRARN